jgi:hypothetical protein
MTTWPPPARNGWCVRTNHPIDARWADIWYGGRILSSATPIVRALNIVGAAVKS